MSKATAEIKKCDNGVTVLALAINGSHYGDYPVSSGHNALSQIEMMIDDAKDYNCTSIELKF